MLVGETPAAEHALGSARAPDRRRPGRRGADLLPPRPDRRAQRALARGSLDDARAADARGRARPRDAQRWRARLIAELAWIRQRQRRYREAERLCREALASGEAIRRAARAGAGELHARLGAVRARALRRGDPLGARARDLPRARRSRAGGARAQQPRRARVLARALAGGDRALPTGRRLQRARRPRRRRRLHRRQHRRDPRRPGPPRRGGAPPAPRPARLDRDGRPPGLGVREHAARARRGARRARRRGARAAALPRVADMERFRVDFYADLARCADRRGRGARRRPEPRPGARRASSSPPAASYVSLLRRVRGIALARLGDSRARRRASSCARRSRPPASAARTTTSRSRSTRSRAIGAATARRARRARRDPRAARRGRRAGDRGAGAGAAARRSPRRRAAPRA